MTLIVWDIEIETGLCLGQIVSGKWVDTQNRKCSNSDILNMFKNNEKTG